MSTGPTFDPASPITTPTGPMSSGESARSDTPGPATGSTAETGGPPGRLPGSRHWLPLIIVIVLAIAIVVPPLFNIGRYQHRIAANIGRSLGRPVHFSKITLRLLPRPGFDLDDFTVEEGPGFGSEPILHSSSVRASVRLLSLWRGRLEIARIALDEPSLNLVRNDEGRWNFASVMTQASQATVAPTGQLGPSRSLRFPYVEASNARINFKYGDEKQPFSFNNGDVSIWLENPEEWQLRFTAQPVRTDMPLFASNTGLIRVEGSMQRAPSLGDIPVNLRAEWTHAPLGQLGRLFGGEDQGWRGELQLRSHLAGTPSRLLVNTTMQLDDLHRVEFAPDQSLSYVAGCTGTYEKALEQLGDLSCSVPLGHGHLAVTGTLRRPEHPSGTQVDLSLVDAPASGALDLLKLTRERISKSLAVSGLVNGHFAIGYAQGMTTVSGSAVTRDLSVSASGLHAPLELGELHLAAFDPGSARSRASKSATRPLNRAAAIAYTPGGAGPLSLLLSPVKVDLGSSTPLIVDGVFNRQNFLLHFGGRGELAKMVPAIRNLGVFAPGIESLQPKGEANIDLQLRGPWLVPIQTLASDQKAAGPSVTASGSISLRDASLITPYLAAPLTIRSAQASISGIQGGSTQVAWSGIVGQYGPIRFTGNFRVPIACGNATDSPTICQRQFDIAIPALNIGALPTVMMGSHPVMHELIEGIRDRIESGTGMNSWPPLHGTIRVARASLDTLALDDVVANIEMQGGHVRIESLDARALDGTLHLSGTVDAGASPAYHLDGQLNQASISSVGELFSQNWGTGTINLATHLSLGGLTRQELMSSAQGMFHFDWSRGGLPVVTSASGSKAVASPFAHFDQWTADGQVQDSGLTLEQSLLTGPDAARAVQGTIGFSTQLNLKSAAAPVSAAIANTGAADGGTLTGTMATPEFTPDAQP
jgi:hypothetical protein